ARVLGCRSTAGSRTSTGGGRMNAPEDPRSEIMATPKWLATWICLVAAFAIQGGCRSSHSADTVSTGGPVPSLGSAFVIQEPAAPGESAVVQTKESQAAMTPQAALERLRAGNARFVAGRPLKRDLPAQVRATAAGQYPFAVVLSCLDSRQSVELIFDQGLGD